MSSTDLLKIAFDGSTVTEEQLETVKKAIRETPIIDNHAHPLLKLEAINKYKLEAIVSEAHGDALNGTISGLSHHRAVRQLAVVLDCEATWKAVLAAIDKKRTNNYDAWVAQCLSGIENILLDDGLDNLEEAQDFTWHDTFTRSKCRRIVRIETVAAEIINTFCKAPKNTLYTADEAFKQFLQEFDTEILNALSDPNVVGFKSVICYRTGLDIPTVADSGAASMALASIIGEYSSSGTRFRRVQHDGLNDLLVHRLAELIRDSQNAVKKPIQFHTGLGDNDITLTKSSPAHLQEFIRTYPTVPVVLLHTGYPYARDAGYLATVYENVYADVGEIFPIVSRHGQEAAVREIFELCPWTKIIWSTDGHWFPETYLLGTLQSREALDEIICDFVRRGDLTCEAAVTLVQDILFGNSNRVYGLGLELPGPDKVISTDRETPKPTLLPPPTTSTSTTAAIWKEFTSAQGVIDFVRISWLDYSSIPRMRMIPFKRFDRLIREGKPLDIGITKASLGLLPNDCIINTVTASGEYRLSPDLSTLTRGPIDGHVNMYGNFVERDGSEVSLCPRTQLMRAIALSAEQGISYLIGFEIEFVLLQRADPSTGGRFDTIENDGHNWSSSRLYANKKIPHLLRDIVSRLDKAGIEVEQLHAESAPGQFELVLPAKAPLEAVDTLLLVRDTIASLATDAGFKFTLHPKPFPGACGTASHVHMSLHTPDGEDVSESMYKLFYASILHHLPALVAFTYPHPTSYMRAIDGAWAGGRWVAWGDQNREVPLRRIEGSHWELKCFDGLANPYLALAALFNVGLNGITDQRELTISGTSDDPAGMTPQQRLDCGITLMLPGSLEEALDVLDSNNTIAQLMSKDVVLRYIQVKRAELANYETMNSHQKREWVLERY